MALVHIREAQTTSIVRTYTLRVRLETYNTLADPCSFAQADSDRILAAAGLATTLTWTSCSVVSTSSTAGVNTYVLDVVVTG